jgi:hypothetical protein
MLCSGPQHLFYIPNSGKTRGPAGGCPNLHPAPGNSERFSVRCGIVAHPYFGWAVFTDWVRAAAQVLLAATAKSRRFARARGAGARDLARCGLAAHVRLPILERREALARSVPTDGPEPSWTPDGVSWVREAGHPVMIAGPIRRGAGAPGLLAGGSARQTGAGVKRAMQGRKNAGKIFPKLFLAVRRRRRAGNRIPVTILRNRGPLIRRFNSAIFGRSGVLTFVPLSRRRG